ncbi:MAG: hypothetical protein H0U44_10310, partial [Flavisolibacter sp.]|nr:hypothetical protein [Flavisolibacter sp.]
AYPRPTTKDSQLKDQPEFVDQQPNDFHDKSISGLEHNEQQHKTSSDPAEEEK